MLRSEGEEIEPTLEVRLQDKAPTLPSLVDEGQTRSRSLFGEWKGAVVLCACGSLVHLDEATVLRRRALGKPVECHRCRNRRVALEREDLDNEFYGPDREGDAPGIAIPGGQGSYTSP
ncbi:MAG TPA: hypothetical protein P5189_03395 [Methanomassiliicoccales archaeon]|nr:hypothetical protein [Methanomassiliicoccales archaeon]